MGSEMCIRDRPPGVGMGRKPQVFLKAGDQMKLSIENLGEQNSKVVAV